MSKDRRDSDYISPWGYIGYAFLWSVPLIGLIIWLVNCFSGKQNLRNYARSIFCYCLICLIMIGVVFVLGFTTGYFQVFMEEILPSTLPQTMV
jgi:hypothetical protein